MARADGMPPRHRDALMHGLLLAADRLEAGQRRQLMGRALRTGRAASASSPPREPIASPYSNSRRPGGMIPEAAAARRKAALPSAELILYALKISRVAGPADGGVPRQLQQVQHLGEHLGDLEFVVDADQPLHGQLVPAETLDALLSDQYQALVPGGPLQRFIASYSIWPGQMFPDGILRQ